MSKRTVHSRTDGTTHRLGENVDNVGLIFHLVEVDGLDNQLYGDGTKIGTLCEEDSLKKYVTSDTGVRKKEGMSKT